MATYYVGSGGNDSNNGLSWANRKLTLNGAEDVPVAAGDTVYVAPGVYRELLTLDVSGSSGSPITYIADVTGEHTDGVGGVVRITGSDNDQTATRANCITATSRNYRTFRGFAFDTTTNYMVSLATACSNWIMEDCFWGVSGANAAAINISGTGTSNTIRRCRFVSVRSNPIYFTHSSTVDNSGHLVENCHLVGSRSEAIRIVRVGGVTIKSCTFFSCGNGVRVFTALSTGQTTTVNNCDFVGCSTAMQAVTSPGTNLEITEDYNNLFANDTDRTNVTAGTHSVAYSPIYQPPLLLSGFCYSWAMLALSQWSPHRALAGTSMSSEDMYGIARPATDSKKSWGAIQFIDASRETSTVHGGSVSIKLADAGRHQMFVPTTNVSTTISVYVQWEANYAGTLPQLVVKQPGQADQTDTATGSSGSWEQLSVTLTPAASPGYCVVELVSNNTATSGNFDCFFDDLAVS